MRGVSSRRIALSMTVPRGWLGSEWGQQTWPCGCHQPRQSVNCSSARMSRAETNLCPSKHASHDTLVRNFGTTPSQNCIRRQIAHLEAKPPSNLHAQLFCRGRLGEAFHSDSLPDFRASRRGDELDGLVIFGCTHISYNTRRCLNLLT